MRFYYIILVLITVFYTKELYSQPPFDEGDCDSVGECIDNMGDFPLGPPPDMDGRHGMMKERMMKPIPPEKIEKMMASLLKEFPDFHKKLVLIKEKNPQVFLRTMHKLRRFIRNDKKGPENKLKLIAIFSDEIDIDILVEKYVFEKDSKKRELIKSEMLKKMSETFDKKEEMKLEIISSIQKNLEKKKSEFSKRKADKDKIIKKDLEEILKHRDKMEKKRAE